jgi:hypothetical protein
MFKNVSRFGGENWMRNEEVFKKKHRFPRGPPLLLPMHKAKFYSPKCQ